MSEKSESGKLTNKRILFIGHDASLTGAPILLLNLLKLLKNDPSIHFDICLQRGGPLLNDFRNLGHVNVLRLSKEKIPFGFLYKIIDAIVSRFRIKRLRDRLDNYDLIFSNTIANGRLLDQLSIRYVLVLSYIHELESVLDYYKKSGDTQLTLGRSNWIISPSLAVSINLQNNHGVKAESILPLAYYFPFSGQILPENKKINRETFCKKWNIDTNQLLIVGAGTVTRRKGTDRFVKVASLLKEVNKGLHFIWVGDFVDAALKTEIDNLMKEEGLSDRITFTGPLAPDPAMFLPFDLFLLPSREDPYPLVVLEAASHGIPAICFKNNGGIAEFVGDDAGWSFDDLSDKELSDVLIKITSDPELIRAKGLVAKKKFYQTHGSASFIQGQINAIFAKVKK